MSVMTQWTTFRRGGACAALRGLALAGLMALSACGKPAAQSDAKPAGGAPAVGGAPATGGEQAAGGETGGGGAPAARKGTAPTAETLPGRVPVYAGTYTATLPAADAAGRTVTLLLKADLTATLSFAFEGRGEPTVETGRWNFHGEELTLELDAQDDSGPPMPLIWRVAGDRLVPKAWSHAHFGETGLPMEKQR